ncbi:molecular chaperone [Halorubrum sp. CBA1125]|uniref:molecular chaperone TorD family protein n=1 Tax=Halorubrum sp. CBA1125 TaxID=2668072 RepID=UPI00135EBA19|nr:molecular chaperone TorD family protein [Halorubrum sp. CBA1125]MUW14431.1 molecular chaperone [Halorubrum sp. CBA1125]
MTAENAPDVLAPRPADLPDGVDPEPSARGALYALCARIFRDPDAELYRALADGTLTATCRRLLDETTLSVTPPDLTVREDHETVSARFNDLFVVGYSEVVDATDGTMDNYGPPVSLYESDYRTEVSWNEVNLDLARAYEFFGCQVDRDVRRNHDHLRLELEFMSYLCRREAAVDPGVAAARIDFHDRHLRVAAAGVAEALDTEPGTGVFGRAAAFLDRFSTADVAELASREIQEPTRHDDEVTADG